MEKVTFANNYKGFPLSESKKNNEGFYVDILEAIHKVFYSMSQDRKRIFFTSFVIKFPAGMMEKEQKDNRVISEFMERFILICETKKYSPKYLWVRERSSTGQVHYHLILLLNYNKIRNAWGLIDIATQVWADCLRLDDASGLVHLCTYCELNCQYGGEIIQKKSPTYFDDLRRAFCKASYLSKVYSKESNLLGVRRYGKSRISDLSSKSPFTQSEVRPKYR